MVDRLYYFGLLGDMNKPPVGGGETSARRVVEGFRNAGFEVITTSRHWNTKLTCLGHIFETGYYTLLNTTELFLKLLFGRRKNSAFFNISYSNVLIPMEFYTGMVAKMLGYKTILYLKGGRLEDVIAGLHGVKKWMFKKSLSIRSVVFFEGESDIARVRPFTNSNLQFFPNYIFEKNIPIQLPERQMESIGICHYGRITPLKKVDVVIDTFEILAEKYPLLRLTIVGGIGGVGGGNQTFYDEIDRRCRESKFADRIIRKGQSTSDYIQKVLDENHLFLFPSADPCEGQSNSLNEAMSRGVVPVVSDFHFNKTIVGDERMVVKGYKPEDYANRISQLIEGGELPRLSNQVWLRIKDVFSYSKVNERICSEIRNI